MNWLKNKKTHSRKVGYVTVVALLLSLGMVFLFTPSNTVFANEQMEEICRQSPGLPECMGLEDTGSTNNGEAGSSGSSGAGSSEPPVNPRADCSDEDMPSPQKDRLHPDNCGITYYIQVITRALTALVGIVVVAMLVFGGVQYSAAGSNPQAVAGAKKHITQALLALVIYIFMTAFLQWIVPGGVF